MCSLRVSATRRRKACLDTCAGDDGQGALTGPRVRHFPLRVVTVLQYEGHPLGADLDEADRTAIFRFSQYLAVSGLSVRRFIVAFPTATRAAGHYQVVLQQFPEPYSGSISLTHRRKGEHANVTMGQSDAHFVRPAHLVAQGKPNLNLPLLPALQSLQLLPKGIHEHVDASVIQFLLANSDSPDVPLRRRASPRMRRSSE
jgi:hypothetical protein